MMDEIGRCAGTGPGGGHGGHASIVRDAAGDSDFPEPRCPACLTVVRSGTLRVYVQGEFYHAYCHHRQLERAALQQYDGGGIRQADVGDARARAGTPPSPRPAAAQACPICQQAATIVGGVAGIGWYAVEGCACGGFFVAAEALDWRLPRLTTAERAELVATIQGFHAMGRDAWLKTADGNISGRLVIRCERPAM
jgi:hypothetical protein